MQQLSIVPSVHTSHACVALHCIVLHSEHLGRVRTKK